MVLEDTTSKVVDICYGVTGSQVVAIYRHRIRMYHHTETLREYRKVTQSSAERLALAVRRLPASAGITLPFATGWNWHRTRAAS